MVNASDSGSRGRGSSPTRVKPCCVLEQGTFTPQKVLVIARKWWLRPNMTEKLFTGTLRINQPTNQPPLVWPLCLNFRLITKSYLVSENQGTLRYNLYGYGTGSDGKQELSLRECSNRILTFSNSRLSFRKRAEQFLHKKDHAIFNVLRKYYENQANA